MEPILEWLLQNGGPVGPLYVLAVLLGIGLWRHDRSDAKHHTHVCGEMKAIRQHLDDKFEAFSKQLDEHGHRFDRLEDRLNQK